MKRIIGKVGGFLARGMVPSNVKRIIGERGVFRPGIGDYRALYRINYEASNVIIFKIDKRERIYN